MKQADTAPRRKTGRPLSFDRDAALRQAMLQFWRHGYESTSLSDLRAAMGVTSPSIYTAFGDKKQLFREAVRKYLSGPVTSQAIIATATTAREAAIGLLRAAAIGYSGSDTPRGCLLATSTICCSPDSADLQRELADIRCGIEASLQAKILADIDAGVLPAETDADAHAGLVMAVIQGLSTLARDGASQAKLLTIANAAMLAWPDGRAA